jgi:hypothetical protein
VCDKLVKEDSLRFLREKVRYCRLRSLESSSIRGRLERFGTCP